MTSTTIPNLTEHRVAPPRDGTIGWGWGAAIFVLFGVFFQSYLSRMFRIATKAEGETVFERLVDAATTQWNHDWSHALVVPLISAYFIYNQWGRIAATPSRVFRPGLAVMLLGMFSFVWWIYPGRNDMFQGYSMIITLFGLVLFLVGPSVMRILWFPILYLALGVKIADRLWEALAWQLQQIAARSATVALQVVGIDASVEGSTISLVFMKQGQWASEALNVAEACSGLRMLMAFVALGLAMAYLTTRRWWQRLIIFVLIIPIAVLVNVGRVTTLGILYLFDKELASGDVHTFIGMLMLIPAGLLFLLLGWILDKIVITAPESAQPGSTTAATASHAAAASDPGRPPWSWGKSITGLVFGAAAMLLAGGVYGLALASMRPDILDNGYGQPVLVGGFIVCAAALAATTAAVWRMLRPETARWSGPREGSLGVAAGVFAVAALGLNTIVGATQTVLIKHAIPLRTPLYQVPERMGEWEMASEDPPMGAEGIEALGTDKYISRVYKITGADAGDLGSYVRLHVAYYTGTPDTVPHVPDRCFVAGGLKPIGTSSVRLTLGGPQYRQENGKWYAGSKLVPEGVKIPATDFDATIFTYAQPSRPDEQSNVVYYFAANDKFLSTPERVRLHGFDPRDRYSYYCKIEVGALGNTDADQAAQIVSRFLSVALPEIMACLPDWDRLNEAQETAPAGSGRSAGITN